MPTPDAARLAPRSRTAVLLRCHRGHRRLTEAKRRFVHAPRPVPPAFAYFTATAAVCEVWAGHADAVPAIRSYLAVLESTDPTAPAPEPQWRYLEQWAYRPAVRAAFTAGLKAALLAGDEEEDETLEWEAWYTYLTGL